MSHNHAERSRFVANFLRKYHFHNADFKNTSLSSGSHIWTNSTNPTYKTLGEWIIQHPKLQTNVYADITKNIVEHHCAHIGVYLWLCFQILV